MSAFFLVDEGWNFGQQFGNVIGSVMIGKTGKFGSFSPNGFSIACVQKMSRPFMKAVGHTSYSCFHSREMVIQHFLGSKRLKK